MNTTPQPAERPSLTSRLIQRERQAAEVRKILEPLRREDETYMDTLRRAVKALERETDRK